MYKYFVEENSITCTDPEEVDRKELRTISGLMAFLRSWGLTKKTATINEDDDIIYVYWHYEADNYQHEYYGAYLYKKEV